MAKKISKKAVTIIVILACGAVVLGVKCYRDYRANNSSAVHQARTVGNPEAKYKIVEFMDYQCPACAHGSRLLTELIEKHPDLFFIQVKYFPLQGHSHAMEAAKYAECSARQGKFWETHHLLFSRQNQWARMFDAKPAFDLIAKDAGLNLRKMKSCLEDKSVEKQIVQDRNEGNFLGIRSTPTFIINDELVVGTKSLSPKISQLLANEQN